MTIKAIGAAIVRAHENGLGTMVFADSPEEAAELAGLGPDIVLAEPPSLIATGQAVGGHMAGFVTRTVELVAAVDPRIIVMSGAGVSTPDDVATVMRLGLGGTGSSSGILRAPDPIAAMWAMLEATARAWAELHPSS
jgi:triosephosphate isomerase